MTDWGLDPGSIEHAAKTLASVVDAALKLRDALARRRREKRPAETRALDKEVDELRASLEGVVDLLAKSLDVHGQGLLDLMRILSPPDVPPEQRPLRMVGNQLAETHKLASKVAELSMLLAAASTKLAERVGAHEKRIEALERGAREAPKRSPRRAPKGPKVG
jgi:alkanesulfonate monooxygenase SsuD/methylene tetrahydromethanopterin reductase-like flavin-dependent oxidoreductase (luciferase family)